MTKVPMPVCRIQDGQMMRDNRIMRTDRPGGNIRLFLCKMKKKKKEVENMKSKYRFRRILSGVMAAVTILSTVISPLTVYASEEPKAAEPPAYESVKDQLDENEVVKATDLELEVGQDFDVSTDFTNLEIKDESKVKVTFQKAENDAGESFSTSHADTYHAVYYVEPVNQNHPVYQIGRNLIVKEPVTAAQSEPQTEQAVTEEDTGSDDEEAASQEETETVPVETEIVEPETAESETEEPEETEPEFQDGLSESEFDAALEESETENTTDEESGLTLSDVLEQAGEQDIDLMAMEDGETVSFTAVNTSTRATQDVDVTRGAAYYYADYGLGSYVTYKYTVKFGNVSATAYCVQPSKAGPGDGVYKITKLGDSKALAKVCYYGTKASGENGFFSEKHPDFSAGKQFIIVHLAASYANNSSDAFSGTNATGQALAMELYNYCMSQPEIPEVDMSFSNANVTAYISGNSQRTEEITFKASELQTITMKLPSGVKLHNVTTGKTSSAGASVEICGGTKFYLSAPLTQAVDVKGEWSVTMKGSIIKDYSAYKITTGSETQDLALVFGEGVTDEKYVEPCHPIQFLPWDNSSFIMQSRKDGYNHLYLCTLGKHGSRMASNTESLEIKQLTSGKWEVMEVLGFNAKRKSIIIASNEYSPIQRNIFVVDTKTGKGIGYEVSENYRFWILWNDKGHNGYFCPEPMTAMIDAPNLNLPKEQTGYQELAPQETFTATQHFFAL